MEKYNDNSNMISQAIKYILFSFILLMALMYIPEFKLTSLEVFKIIALTIVTLILVDNWCPSKRYCVRNMDKCINI